MENIITLAFYKADCSSATILDKIIALYTGGPYSHVEVIVREGNWPQQWSASPRTKKVRKKYHKFNKEKWDYIDIVLPNKEAGDKFLSMIEDDEYDWLAILGFVIPIRDRKHKWTCSEIASNYLKVSGFEPMLIEEPFRMSPNSLARLVGLIL